jgi:hypothetical protein
MIRNVVLTAPPGRATVEARDGAASALAPLQNIFLSAPIRGGPLEILGLLQAGHCPNRIILIKEIETPNVHLGTITKRYNNEAAPEAGPLFFLCFRAQADLAEPCARSHFFMFPSSSIWPSFS